ncbi:MAG TPA: hypothetical protein VN132_02330 [Bdellovibrio sp.]|nr:hypothetical protein [Bdellovibrio sp.]
MTIEYVLLLCAVFGLVLKAFLSAPADAFKKAGPKMGARIERQIETGGGFRPDDHRMEWGN